MHVRRWAAGFLATLSIAGPADAACDELLPSPRTPTAIQRGVTAQDLIGLRNIGSPDAATLDVPSPLAVSPDGSQLAFVMTRADPVRNATCRGLVIVPLSGPARPRLVDRGGEDMLFGAFIRGIYMDYGTPHTVTPVWSADGRSLFYLKRVSGRTSLWRIDTAGGSARPAAVPDFDIETVLRPNEGTRLLLSGRPAIPAIERAVDEEGRSGWHFDERVLTNQGARPKVRETDAPLQIFAFDPDSGQLSPPTAAEQTFYPIAMKRFTDQSAMASDGSEARIAPVSLSLLSQDGLSLSNGATNLRCAHEACRGRLLGVWRDPAGRDVLFMRHEGWNNEATALYRWSPATNRLIGIRRTLNALQGCAAARRELICTDENTAVPRRIVRIDVKTGRQSLLFDPNPAFADVRLGPTRRLRWRNDRGLPAWGDLVLPPNYRRGQRVPLVVVQYDSRGFLRGGTNDEYPVFLFAQRGMAVLSIQRPPFIGMLDPGLTTIAAITRVNFAGWAEHASLFSSVKTGIQITIAAGIADPRSLGITGLSDGATLTRYALINSALFKAAAISSCCTDPNTVMAYGGIAWAEENIAAGLPPLRKPDPSFWQKMSLAQNAERIDTPLLMQLADREFLLAMEAYEQLREHGKPVDLYVFPDEYHGKSQPGHRLAIYQRSVDWFAFWLQGIEDPSPGKQDQYRRWEAMRAKLTQDSHRLPSQASASTSRMIR